MTQPSPPLKSQFFQLAWHNDPEQGGIAGDPHAKLALLTCTAIRFVHPPLVLTHEEYQDLRWLLDQPPPTTDTNEVSLWGTILRPGSPREARVHYWLPWSELGQPALGTEKKPLVSAIFRIHQYLKTLYTPGQAIILFRIGNFYETYDENVRTVARILDIVLASRPVEGNQRTSLAGFPVFSAEGYIKKLTQAGYIVVKCEKVDRSHSTGGVTGSTAIG